MNNSQLTMKVACSLKKEHAKNYFSISNSATWMALVELARQVAQITLGMFRYLFGPHIIDVMRRPIYNKRAEINYNPIC